MTRVYSQQNDTVDLVCLRHYGYTGGVTEQVYKENPGLADRGAVLPAGVEIELPETPVQQEKKTINLWD